MAAVISSKPAELGLAAFTPAEGSMPIQTPYGSLQLANSVAQQQQQKHTMSYLNMGANAGGESDEEEEEEEGEEDDDEDGATKGKRKRGKGTGGKKIKKEANKAASSSGSGMGAGDRDMHTGRRKIRIEFIEDDSRRHITFSKRKAGIMKKAYELATLTGTQVLLLIVSQTGLVYTFTTPKLSPVVQQSAGRELIQSCLNAPEPNDAAGKGQEIGEEDDSNEGETSQDSSTKEEYGNHGGYPQSTGIQQHPHMHHQQQLQPDHQSTHSFFDPRNAPSDPSQISTLNFNLPHLNGMAYGGYPSHHMSLHDQAIPYPSYGL